MVSLASEQWPDTVLPSVETIEPHENTRLTLRIAPEHLFLAWEQLSLELAKIPCEVVCQFKPNPIQKTIFVSSGNVTNASKELYCTQSVPNPDHFFVVAISLTGFVDPSSFFLIET